MRFFLLLALLFRLSQPKLLKKEVTHHTRSSNSDRLPFSHHFGNLKHRLHKNPFQLIDQSDSDSTGLNHSNYKISPALSRPFRSRREVDEKVQEAEKNETDNEQLITTLEADLKAENLTLDKLVTDTDNKKKDYDDAMKTFKQKTADISRLSDASIAAGANVSNAQSAVVEAGEEVRQQRERRDHEQQDVERKETAAKDAQALLDHAQEELRNGLTRLPQLSNSVSVLKDDADSARENKLIAQTMSDQAITKGACKESTTSSECLAEIKQKKKAATDAANAYNQKELAYTKELNTKNALERNVTITWPKVIGQLNKTVVERSADHQTALQRFTQKKYEQTIAAAVAAEESAVKSLEDAKKQKLDTEDELKKLSFNAEAEANAVNSAKEAWETAKAAKEEKEKHTKELQGKLTAAENSRSELKEKVDQAKKDAAKKSESSVGLIIGIVLAVIFVIILLLGCVCCRMKKRRAADDAGPSKRRSKSRSKSKSKDFKIKSSNISNTTASSTEKISGSASDSNLTNTTASNEEKTNTTATSSSSTESTTKPAVAAAPVMKLERDNSKPYGRDYSNCVKRFPNHVYKTPKGTLAPYPPNASPRNTTPASELISKGRIDCKVIYARDHKYVSSTPSSSVAQITYNFSKEYRFHIVPPFARKENNKVSKQFLKAEKMVKGNYECDELIREITAEEYASSDNLRYNFDYLDVELVLKCMLEFYKEGKALARMKSPLVIVGDTHGQLACLIAMFSMFTEDNKPGFLNRKYLFLGDYVDRGNKSLEVIMLLFMFKLKFGDNFVLLRGNHETSGVNATYGFKHELMDRFGKYLGLSLYDKFNEVFSYMPFACVIDDEILCMHGGLSEKLTSLEAIEEIPLPLVDVNSNELARDLMWADPLLGLIGFCFNITRGSSVFFGENVVKDTLKRLKLKMIVRAHQTENNGYEFFGVKDLVTVFSCTNNHVAGVEKSNHAAVMEIDKDKVASLKIFATSQDALYSAAEFRAEHDTNYTLDYGYSVYQKDGGVAEAEDVTVLES